MAASPPRTRPLLIREGVRFACAFGGGCCSDVHTLGPVSKAEAARILRVMPDSIEFDATHACHALRTDRDGWCVMLSAGKCSLHSTGGPAAKPRTCRQFPFALVATPVGGRVVTAHRCPCRSLGPRPPLSQTVAESALTDSSGRMRAAARTPARIPQSSHTTISFASYLAVESPIIRRLVRGDPPAEALGAVPSLPERDLRTWRGAAKGFQVLAADPSREGQALGWFSLGMLGAIGEMPSTTHARPWRGVYDRAEAGCAPVPRERVLGDFLADKIWDFEWLSRGGLDRARATLAALARVGAAITERLVRDGARPDRAAAEAVLALEIGMGTEGWAIAIRSAWSAAATRGSGSN